MSRLQSWWKKLITLSMSWALNASARPSRVARMSSDAVIAASFATQRMGLQYSADRSFLASSQKCRIGAFAPPQFKAIRAGQKQPGEAAAMAATETETRDAGEECGLHRPWSLVFLAVA